jgi:hypothetical protein
VAGDGGEEGDGESVIWGINRYIKNEKERGEERFEDMSGRVLTSRSHENYKKIN